VGLIDGGRGGHKRVEGRVVSCDSWGNVKGEVMIFKKDPCMPLERGKKKIYHLTGGEHPGGQNRGLGPKGGGGKKVQGPADQTSVHKYRQKFEKKGKR